MRAAPNLPALPTHTTAPAHLPAPHPQCYAKTGAFCDEIDMGAGTWWYKQDLNPNVFTPMMWERNLAYSAGSPSLLQLGKFKENTISQ